MSILAAQVGLLADTLAKAATPPVTVGMGSVVDQFAGQSDARLRALGSVCRTIADATSAGRRFHLGVSAADFAVLKAFVAFADSEFALAEVCRPDDAVDQPFYRDESHFRDRERL